MRRVAALSFLLIVFPALAFAKTFPIPDDDPVATISVPDNWEPKPYDGGVELTSPDDKVYMAVEEVKASDVGGAVEEGVKWFAKQGVEIDEKSMKSQEIKVNNLPAFDMSMKGKDSDGATEVGMTLIHTNSDSRFLLFYYWGSDEAQKANAKDIQKIIDSLQATK